MRAAPHLQKLRLQNRRKTRRNRRNRVRIGMVSRERIEALYPQLLPALWEHPGIGFVLVRSEQEGALAIG